MTELHTLRKTLGLAVICAGLVSLPLAANAANADAEIMTAATHAGFASKASSIKMVHEHMHHAINCLVGPKGKGFDKMALNPCKSSGMGAIPDSTNSKQKMALEKVVKTLHMGLMEKNMAKAQKTAMMAEHDLKMAGTMKDAKASSSSGY